MILADRLNRIIEERKRLPMEQVCRELNTGYNSKLSAGASPRPTICIHGKQSIRLGHRQPGCCPDPQKQENWQIKMICQFFLRRKIRFCSGLFVKVRICRGGGEIVFRIRVGAAIGVNAEGAGALKVGL